MDRGKAPYAFGPDTCTAYPEIDAPHCAHHPARVSSSACATYDWTFLDLPLFLSSTDDSATAKLAFLGEGLGNHDQILRRGTENRQQGAELDSPHRKAMPSAIPSRFGFVSVRVESGYRGTSCVPIVFQMKIAATIPDFSITNAPISRAERQRNRHPASQISSRAGLAPWRARSRASSLWHRRACLCILVCLRFSGTCASFGLAAIVPFHFSPGLPAKQAMACVPSRRQRRHAESSCVAPPGRKRVLWRQ